MKPKLHHLGLWLRDRKLKTLTKEVAYAPWKWDGLREAWSVTGSANAEEARRRVARVKAGVSDPAVRRLK